MEYANAVGTTFLTRYTDAGRFPLLVIGKDRWSFAEIAEIGVMQARACRILSGIAKSLGVKSLRELYQDTSPYSLAGTHGCGVTTLYVALRVFDSRGLDAEQWYARGQKQAVVTFTRLKHREQVAEARTKGKRRRK